MTEVASTSKELTGLKTFVKVHFKGSDSTKTRNNNI